jgi:hypothetical protein
MRILSMLATVVMFGACGDNIKPKMDAPPAPSDAGVPAVPALGVQIDRMGRPAVNTALNNPFNPTGSGSAAKDAYNADGSPGGWSQYAPLFAGNLAILDALDTGLGTNGGCGNQALYNNGQGGAANPQSYAALAGILADDELNLDTSMGMCNISDSNQNYLSVEFAVVIGLPNTVCGGRDPLNDVMATSYTLLAIGIAGFALDGKFTPAFSDGATVHADVDDQTFPFLGAPH